MEWHSVVMGFYFPILLRWQKPATDKVPHHFPPAGSCPLATSGIGVELVPEECEEEDNLSPPL